MTLANGSTPCHTTIILLKKICLSTIVSGRFHATIKIGEVVNVTRINPVYRIVEDEEEDEMILTSTRLTIAYGKNYLTH
jgi:hypothetical protein